MTSFYVSSGQTLSGFGVSRTYRLFIESGGVTTATTVFNGGVETVKDGGAAIDTLVSRGGRLYVSSGGEVSSSTVLGVLVLSSGALVSEVVVGSGARA